MAARYCGLRISCLEQYIIEYVVYTDTFSIQHVQSLLIYVHSQTFSWTTGPKTVVHITHRELNLSIHQSSFNY